MTWRGKKADEGIIFFEKLTNRITCSKSQEIQLMKYGNIILKFMFEDFVIIEQVTDERSCKISLYAASVVGVQVEALYFGDLVLLDFQMSL